MMKKQIAAIAGSLLLLVSQGLAVSAKRPMVIPGQEACQRVSQLTTDITWTHSLQQAEAVAQKQGKMIFWVQMLGDMAGAT